MSGRLVFRSAFLGAGCVLLATTIVDPPKPHLVWNASASAPVGLYAVSPGARVHVGDMVVARPPAAMRQLAAQRHYLPLGVPLVKRIAAGPGNRICALGVSILIDGRIVALRRGHDRAGRGMPAWSGCRRLRDGQYLLLMATVPESFDGRYFGITGKADIIGRARLLWRR